MSLGHFLAEMAINISPGQRLGNVLGIESIKFSPVRHSRQAKTKFSAITRKRRAKAQR